MFSLSPSAGSVWLNVLRGPLEVLGGAVTGVALGYFLRYFPSRDQVCELQLYDWEVHVEFRNWCCLVNRFHDYWWFVFCPTTQGNLVLKRSFLVLGLAVFALFGSNVAGVPGAGGLCTLILTFVAAVGWGKAKVWISPPKHNRDVFFLHMFFYIFTKSTC